MLLDSFNELIDALAFRIGLGSGLLAARRHSPEEEEHSDAPEYEGRQNDELRPHGRAAWLFRSKGSRGSQVGARLAKATSRFHRLTKQVLSRHRLMWAGAALRRVRCRETVQGEVL